jgi:hypothetical protein
MGVPARAQESRPGRLEGPTGRETVMASQPASVSAILKAIDIARTIEWYRQVGFDIREVFPEEGEPTWCELSRDGVILQFLGGDETPWPGPPAFTGTLTFIPTASRGYSKRSGTTPCPSGDPKSANGVPESSACKTPTDTSSPSPNRSSPQVPLRSNPIRRPPGTFATLTISFNGPSGVPVRGELQSRSR